MKICYFGAYQRSHPRNAVILNAMEQQNVTVFECHSTHPVKALRYPILTVKFFRGCLASDVIYVAAMGHYYVFWAWILARLTGKSLVFDPLVSMYDTLVHDRQLVVDGSIFAKWLWFLDKSACTLVDKVILDTNVHVDYFVDTFNLNVKKFCVVPVGADESIFHPQAGPPPNDKGYIEVLYVGNFIPLHGVSYILEAAYLLRNEPFRFLLVGDGQTFTQTRQQAEKLALNNIAFIGRVSRERYAEMLNQTDIVLGIFGDSNKAKRVIPCKVYDACAVGKPIVTGDTLAIRHYFSNGVDVSLCEPQNGRSLAEAIQLLGGNSKERERMGEQARGLFEKLFSTNQIGQGLVTCLSELLA